MINLSLYSTYKALKAKGIMGMNTRNRCFIGPYNSRRFFPLVDNKLKTKKLALAHHLNAPDLLGVIDNQHDVNDCAKHFPADQGFCIKPAKGSGGKGILIVKRNDKGELCRSNNTDISIPDIQRHISNTLAGVFSLGGSSDVAMFESLIEVDESLTPFSYEGVPDIRVIVFQGIPIMAMIRLSCAASKGKANLHQGAVGVGLDILTGKALRGVQFGRPIKIHPDTGATLSELVVKDWTKLLYQACSCYDITNLGYIGVDLVLDKNKGPILLELNARPGLAIQVANNAGLLPRLRFVEKNLGTETLNIEQRLDFCRKMAEHCQ